MLSGAFRITSTISRPRASTATNRARAKQVRIARAATSVTFHPKISFPLRVCSLSLIFINAWIGATEPLRAPRMDEAIAANALPSQKTPYISDLCCLAGDSATRDDDRLRAVTRPWGAGAGISDFARRTNRDLGKL